MRAKNSDLPTDLMSLLEDNFKQGKPLLEDAVLYRGTRVPDQTSGSFSADTMHGSLLPQVAASYTHNWSEDTSFIGTYKVDRAKTRFFKDYGLEQQLEGKAVTSMSVKEAERILEPYVKELVTARDGQARGRAEERLESAIKHNLYESNIPTRTPDQAPNRPADLYIYRGRPDIAIRRAIGMQMTKVGPHNEAQAKAVMFREHRNAAVSALHRLSTQPGPAQKAMTTLANIALQDSSKKMQAEHGHKPLNQMMTDVAKQPLAAEQERLGKFGRALMEGLKHPTPAVQEKAASIIGELAKLDGSKATYQDVAKISANAATKVSSTANVTQKSADTPKAPQAGRTSPALDR